MGGGYYDRDIESTYTLPPQVPSYQAPSYQSNAATWNHPNSTFTTYSVKADSIFNQNRTLDPKLDPKNRNLTCESRNPIICAVDVTGSMGNWAKTIWDKLPMFYGQLISRGYVEDPSISFAGVGDAFTDKVPLQIAEFRQGTALDEEIQKLFLEGGGGGQHYESYELCGYFYNRHCNTPKKEKGFFFFMGDEGFYPKVKAGHIQSVIGDEVPEDVDSATVFAGLRNKFHVFFIHKPYWDKEIDKKQLVKWKAVVGEDRILELVDPKSIVDIILGAIAIVGRTRTLEQYILDLQDRGQTTQRIEDVSRCLKIVMDRLNNPSFPSPGAESDDLTYFSLSPSNAPAPSNSGSWPQEYLCPITEKPMEDPVMAMDGHTYEREAVVHWLEKTGTSPMTGEFISRELVPNVGLRNAIAQFKKKNNIQ